MRWSLALVALLVVGACSTPEGAYLTIDFTAAGPMLDHVDVVLTGAGVVTATAQRSDESADRADIMADYYVQAAIGGTFAGANLTSGSGSAFTLQIKPTASELEAAQDGTGATSFDVFAIAYDGNQDPLAVGAYVGSGTAPTPITIDQSGEYEYTPAIVLEMVTQATAGSAIAAGEAEIVQCLRDPAAPFPSGLAWQPVPAPNEPSSTHQVRIVFPDTTNVPDYPSAEDRMHRYDLDCDGVVAVHSGSGSGAVDCDDLAAGVFPGQTNACSLDAPLLDTSCGVDTSVGYGECTITPPSMIECIDAAVLPTGILVCDPAAGAAACLPNPACACGSPIPFDRSLCHYCNISMYPDADGYTTCAMSGAQLDVNDWCGDGCTVTVLDPDPAWMVTATTPVQNVTSGDYFTTLTFAGSSSTVSTTGQTNVATFFLDFVATGTTDHDIVPFELVTGPDILLATPADCGQVPADTCN